MAINNLKTKEIEVSKAAKREKREKRRAAKKDVSTNGRSSETKKPLERILIVSEGKKTEPIYFNYLIEHFRLSTADIEVTGAAHSCPYHVVSEAVKLYDKSMSNKEVYDKVFCIIDKDSHPKYNNALEYAKTLPADIFYIINSIPCFELWLLLHYEYTIKSFSKTARRSICESLIKNNLKKYLPNYEKNISNLNKDELLYILNDDNIKAAISNAKKVLLYCTKHSIDNPSTKIHDLVLILQKLRDEKKEILK